MNQQVVSLTEQIATWRLRIRLWNILHQRYRAALHQGDSPTARRLFNVLRETRMVNK